MTGFTRAFLLATALTFGGCSGGGSAPAGSPSGGVVPESLGAPPASFAIAPEDQLRFNAPLLPPHGTIYLGAYVATEPGETPQQQIIDTGNFEAKIGRTLAIDMHYHLWSDTLAGIGERDDAAKGRIPLVSWSCVDADKTGVKDADIAAGLYDTAIAKRAAVVAAFGQPIFLRYKWEMNLVYNAGCADPAHDKIDKYGKTHYSPVEYVAAWQHIRSIFAANGATNVVWLWNPSGNGDAPDTYYPGDSQVDWVGFDWYDTFDLYFNPIYRYSYDKKTGHELWTYPYLASHYPNKPLMIGETGAEQLWQKSYFRGDGSQDSAEQALRKSLKHIQAYVYWNSHGARGDFAIGQAAFPAFKKFANSHYLSGRQP